MTAHVRIQSPLEISQECLTSMPAKKPKIITMPRSI